MKRILLPILIAASLASARASIFDYTITFAPEAVGAQGTGTGTAQYDDVAHLLQLQAVFSGLSPGGSGTTVSHIHLPTASPFTGTAGVVITPGTLPGFPVGVFSGSYSNVFDMTSSSTYPAAFVTANGGVAGAEAAVFSAMQAGKAYWNIHTGNFGGGEIRGFLTVVPEPSSLALVSLGSAGVALRVCRRRESRKAWTNGSNSAQGIGLVLRLLRQPMRHCLSCSRLALLISILIGTGVLVALAASPRIDYIEPFQKDKVLIHFDTDPNFTYELQYTERLGTNGIPAGPWTNLFVAPNLPSPNHYVIVDTRMSKQRYYRLHAYRWEWNSAL
jgi:hypothetical protein